MLRPSLICLCNTAISYCAGAIWDTEACELEVFLVFPKKLERDNKMTTVAPLREHHSSFTLSCLLDTMYVHAIPHSVLDSIRIVCPKRSVSLKKILYNTCHDYMKREWYVSPTYDDESAELEDHGVTHGCKIVCSMKRSYELVYDKARYRRTAVLHGRQVHEFNMLCPPVQKEVVVRRPVKRFSLRRHYDFLGEYNPWH